MSSSTSGKDSKYSPPSEIELLICDALKRYGDLKMRELKTTWQMSKYSERKIRKTIEALRDEGVAIGSSARRGYFMIKTEADWEEAVKEFRAKALACLKMKKQLEDIGSVLFSNQTKLDFEGGERHGDNMGTPAGAHEAGSEGLSLQG